MQLSLSSLLLDRAGREPERTAVLTANASLSYGEVAAEATALATLLVDLGLGHSRIMMMLPNIPRFGSIFHGILGAGGTAVMCNALNSPREVAEQLADSDSAAAFTTEALRGLLPVGTRALLVDELPAGIREASGDVQRWTELPAAGALPVPPRGGAEPAAILFTAAERGRARGAVLTHRSLIANLRSTVEMMRLGEDDRMLAALPQVHAFGLTVGLNAAMAAGATMIPVERFHPVRTLELLATTGATVFAGVPAMFMGILSVLERSPVPAHSLRITLSGGAPIHPRAQARWEELFGVSLRQGYGLTEASPVCLFNIPDHPNRPGTLGVPIPRVQVSIQDCDGVSLPEGEVGEICVRGENLFAGYLGPAGVEADNVRAGWLRTGDLGTRSADGCIRFAGILKPMFTRSGFNVYPRELERVVGADPRVGRVRVYAQPDPAKENEIILEVEPARGSALMEEEIREICKATLAAYKQPGRILIA